MAYKHVFHFIIENPVRISAPVKNIKILNRVKSLQIVRICHTIFADTQKIETILGMPVNTCILRFLES